MVFLLYLSLSVLWLPFQPFIHLLLCKSRHKATFPLVSQRDNGGASDRARGPPACLDVAGKLHFQVFNPKGKRPPSEHWC